MEKFIVSARKYRPGNFNDVVGQGAITTTLRNSIKNNHLGHAYLFSGPRGVGKTTCARIFAKTINCEKPGPEGDACNACESCLSFIENRSYSIHELDAASNNSVDDIRTLTEQVRIPPQIGKYSIYIIDEVHMLSQSAFNAFLKTLEEPPAHAIFVLATTEKHKIIPTILSRCQIFDFNRIRVEDAAAYLKQIAEKEGIAYEDDALHVIAQKADGAMRDALSIFDQVVSFSGQKISYQDVIRNLNILDYDYFFRLTFSLQEGDVASALLLFDEILSKGFDARNFINSYAAHLRDLLVCKNPETVGLLEVGAGIREKYLAQSKDLPLPFIYGGLEICNQADIQYRSSRNQRLSIELALVKLAGLTEAQKKKLSKEPTDQAAENYTKPPGESDRREGKPSEASLSSEGSADSKEGSSDYTGPPNGINAEIRSPAISIKAGLKGEDGQEQQAAKDPDKAGEENSGKETESMRTEPEVLLKAWKDYAASLEKSKPRIYSTLINHEPEIREDGKVRIRLNSEAQRDNFQKNIKPALIAWMKKHAGISVLEMETEVTENGTAEKKVYTEEDKLDFLMKKNPELGQLKSRFNLDFDN